MPRKQINAKFNFHNLKGKTRICTVDCCAACWQETGCNKVIVKNHHVFNQDFIKTVNCDLMLLRMDKIWQKHIIL